MAGLVVLLHLQPFLEQAQHGETYRDSFHVPYVSWYPEGPEWLYIVLLWMAAGAAVLVSIGAFTRVTVVYVWAFITWNTFLSQTNFHNNRAYLIVIVGGLALSRCGHAWSLDAWWARRRGRPLAITMPGWPLWLMRFEASAIYLASGTSKLVDPDWFGGLVTWDRVNRVQDKLHETPLPDWFIRFISDRDFHTVMAKVIVATELFIGLGLWFRRSRLAAVVAAVAFHVLVEVAADVQVFSYLGLSALVIWWPQPGRAPAAGQPKISCSWRPDHRPTATTPPMTPIQKATAPATARTLARLRSLTTAVRMATKPKITGTPKP
jgi:uncharacterized membrane protein YphA (DoxX/SURF4 family)